MGLFDWFLGKDTSQQSQRQENQLSAEALYVIDNAHRFISATRLTMDTTKLKDSSVLTRCCIYYTGVIKFFGQKAGAKSKELTGVTAAILSDQGLKPEEAFRLLQRLPEVLEDESMAELYEKGWNDVRRFLEEEDLAVPMNLSEMVYEWTDQN